VHLLCWDVAGRVDMRLLNCQALLHAPASHSTLSCHPVSRLSVTCGPSVEMSKKQGLHAGALRAVQLCTAAQPLPEPEDLAGDNGGAHEGARHCHATSECSQQHRRCQHAKCHRLVSCGKGRCTCHVSRQLLHLQRLGIGAFFPYQPAPARQPSRHSPARQQPSYFSRFNAGW